MKSRNEALIRGLAISVLLISMPILLAGCGGGHTDGDGQSYDGTAYNDASAGQISLEVIEDQLNVAQTSGFRVRVVDASGVGVPDVEIACDTETGLALLEPTTGFELTDSSGQMSGRVGCVTPGSYQIGCRLPVGGNKRSLKTVICQGPIPDGFTGFPGAGGGSLGTGGTPPGSGGAVPPANSGSLGLSAVTISENGSDTLSVDVVRGTCGFKDQNGDGDTTDAGDVDPEPFSDTLAKFVVKNDTAESVNFSSFSYEVSGASGTGTFFSSSELAFSLGGSVAAGKQDASLTGLFLKANSTTKNFTGSSAAISSSLGFRNVTFTLFGTTASGKSIEVQASVAVSFGNFDSCSS
jgi:hypothetical protein